MTFLFHSNVDFIFAKWTVKHQLLTFLRLVFKGLPSSFSKRLLVTANFLKQTSKPQEPMTNMKTPFRVKLKLQGANLIFTVFASDKYEAMNMVQEQHPSASVVSAGGSDELIGTKGSGTWM